MAPVRADEPPAIAAAASLRFALDEIARRLREGDRPAGAHHLRRHRQPRAPDRERRAVPALARRRRARASRSSQEGGRPTARRACSRRGASVSSRPSARRSLSTASSRASAGAGRGKVKHFAIANPEVAPYGVAAREALQKAGLWTGVEPLLVLGENIGQAAQFATTGAAEAGIIAQSLAVSAELKPKITAALIPEAWHKPIQHGMALIKGAGKVAQRLRRLHQRERGARHPGGQRLLRAAGLRSWRQTPWIGRHSGSR